MESQHSDPPKPHKTAKGQGRKQPQEFTLEILKSQFPDSEPRKPGEPWRGEVPPRFPHPGLPVQPKVLLFVKCFNQILKPLYSLLPGDESGARRSTFSWFSSCPTGSISQPAAWKGTSFCFWRNFKKRGRGQTIYLFASRYRCVPYPQSPEETTAPLC